MERTGSPEYQPELQEGALHRDFRAQYERNKTFAGLSEVRLDLGDGGGGGGSSGGDEGPANGEDAKPAGGHNAQVLEPMPRSRRIYVEIQHVEAFVPRSFKPPSTLSRLGRLVRRRSTVAAVDSKKYRQVLYDVNGCVRPGEVLALMGPSGGGKTTLLSIMGARSQKMMQVRGKVTFNGQVLSKRLKRQIGYVMQDDLLYESLTVYEVLYYAAMLRLPRGMSHTAKMARVEAVIVALGLNTCRNTIVGGFFRKGISGGERKRTSVGHELLIDPSLLFLDEPTSGLDSSTALHLLSVLRGLASGGRSVVTTIHQPSSRLYQQLDKLLLLSQGHVMFYGQAAAAAEFFSGLGYVLPYGVNAADFLLDLASGDVAAAGRDGEESRVFLVEASEAFLRGHQLEGYTSGMQVGLSGQQLPEASHGGSSSTGVEASSGPPSPSAGSTGPKALPSSRSAKTLGGKTVGSMDVEGASWEGGGAGRGEGEGHGWPGGKDGGDRWGASYLSQIDILLRRSLKTRRFEAFSVQMIFQLLSVAVLAGLFWLQKANKETVVSARDTLGLLFFSLMFLSIRVMFTALFTFPNEFKMLLKERASGMYRLSAFYFARLLSDLPMDLTLPTIFMLIVYFMGGLRYNAAAFFGFYGTNLLAMLVAQSLGLWIGCAVMNPKSAQAIASVLIMLMVLTAGYFVLGLPSWISWVKYLSYIYYGLGILLYIEFDGGNRTLYTCVEQGGTDVCTPTNPGNPETDPTCHPTTDLQSALNLVQDPSDQGQAVRNACILVGMLLAFRLGIYWTLRRKTRA